MTNADGNFSPEWKSILAGFLTFHGMPKINILLCEILNLGILTALIFFYVKTTVNVKNKMSNYW